MHDKCDEVANDICNRFAYSVPDNREEMARMLRSAFPPPAEDAGECADAVYGILTGEDEGMSNHTTRHEVAAEIERFAESRMEPWRKMVDEILNYCIANRGVKDWEFYKCATYAPGEFPDWVHKARAALERKEGE